MELFFPESLLNFFVRGNGTFLGFLKDVLDFLLDVLGLLCGGEEGEGSQNG